MEEEKKTPFCVKFGELAEIIESYVTALSDDDLSEYLKKELSLYNFEDIKSLSVVEAKNKQIAFSQLVMIVSKWINREKYRGSEFWKELFNFYGKSAFGMIESNTTGLDPMLRKVKDFLHSERGGIRGTK